MNTGLPAFGETVGRLPARRAVEGVARMVKRYISERNGKEDFSAYVQRIGMPSIRASLKDLMELRPGALQDDLFVDLGETTAFGAKTGVGECAA